MGSDERGPIIVLATGDIILDHASHNVAFAHVQHLLKDADLTIGTVDQVFSDLGDSADGFWPVRHGAPPHVNLIAASGYRWLDRKQPIPQRPAVCI